ncbi:MAG: hypothetical protein M1820_007418 [Bogoriella megaspora]|nr:MAG: hypothetical protein M1820_007418 [Bogoriella megaspora]
MADEKHEYRYADEETLPIPTYEEATSSRPVSSQSTSRRGPAEISDDAERQTLLAQPSSGGPQNGGIRTRHGYYQPPSAQSVRSSLDSEPLASPDAFELSHGEMGGDDAHGSEDEEEGLRRDMEDMEVVDLESDSRRRRREMRARMGKRWAQFRSRFTSWKWPFRIPQRDSTLYTRLPNIPEQYRPGMPIVARLFGLFLIASLVYALFVFAILPRTGHGTQYNPESVRQFVQGHVDENRIREYLRYITSYDHVAGTEGSFTLGKWIGEMFEASEMDQVATLSYEVYLNYPRSDGRRVAIVEPASLAWTAKLEEEPVYPPGSKQQTLVFHGHSRSGNVTGPLIYGNYGSKADFKSLTDGGVNTSGAIMLMRYGGSQSDRALKIEAAEEAGAAGALIYSDPAETGFKKGKPWPDGPWLPWDGVQRGAVSLMSWVVGDVLTPGWASVAGADRLSKDNNPGLVNIPSLPLSWRDAQTLLQSLKGHGKQLQDGEKDWVGGVPDVGWWTGAQDSPKVNLVNEQDEVEKQPIYNIHGLIEGVETPQQKIIIGNHRDSWCFGAGDPGSGTAVMMELVNIFGELRHAGWRPLRTLEFVSWDAEEYNLIGSTEYVEENVDLLRRDGVAYLNVDVGVTGDRFRAAASPVFFKPLMHVLDRVTDPVRNVSIRQIWDEGKSKIEGLGAGSDFVAFQDIAGISSIDFGFEGEPGSFPYHSCYETFEWMDRFGDPGFQYHKVMAQIWALLILELSDRPVLPFDLNNYAAEVESYVRNLGDYAGSHGAPKEGNSWSTDVLGKATQLFKEKASEFQKWEDAWSSRVFGRGGMEDNAIAMQRWAQNARMIAFEKDLLDIPRLEGASEEDQAHQNEGGDGKQYGVPGREQFKHILFAPELWGGYDPAFFPAVRDAIDAGNWTAAQAQVQKAADILTRASNKLTS